MCKSVIINLKIVYYFFQQKLDCNSTTPKEIFESGEALTIELNTGNADPDQYHFRFLITSYESK
jgi:hypothetical protein